MGFSPLIPRAEDKRCEDVFPNSRLSFENRAVIEGRNDLSKLPKFVDIFKEQELQKHWNTPPEGIPEMLKILFPADVHFIGHQQQQPGTPTAVKLGEPGAALMARAYYSWKGHTFGTNVAFSTKALVSNMQNLPEKQKWLVSTDARAAILFLHGGGTRSTGAHVAEGMINHFKSYRIDVLSLDLPWHGEGPRELFKNMETEIQALGAFAKKYIPPHVPLFVWGHSWGSVYAEKLMTMTDKPPNDFLFHQNLKGVMIYSTVVDSSPGGSFREKYDEFFKRQTKAKSQLIDKFAENEAELWQEIVQDGKISPLGSFYSMLSIMQLDQVVPPHKGAKYLPAIMVVGTADPLVYVGFEDIYHNYYGKMKNIQTHYLDKLPLYSHPDGPSQRVGHLIGDHVSLQPAPSKAKELVHYQLSRKFIEEQLGFEILPEKELSLPQWNFISIIQHFANDLAFRRFLMEYEYFTERKTAIHTGFLKQQKQIWQEVADLLLPYGTVYTRTRHLLQQLRDIKKTAELQDLILESHTLTTHFAPNFRNQVLMDFFENLQDPASHIPLKTLRSKAQEMLTRFFNQKTSHKSNKPDTPLMKTLFPSHQQDRFSVENATEVLAAQKLPKDLHNQVIQKVRQWFDMATILDGTYVPPADRLFKTRGLVPREHQDKVHTQLHQISLYAEKIRTLTREINELSGKISRLQKEYYLFLPKVRHRIKEIREALALTSLEPPPSLKKDFEKSRRDFKKLEKTSDQVIHHLELQAASFMKDHQNAQSVLINIHTYSPYLEKYKSQIDDLSRLYEKYVEDRQQLKKKLIVAMEQGELGPDLQNAVVDLYGTGSRGERPQLGAKSLFLTLESHIQSLARHESILYSKNKERAELILLSQDLSDSVLNQIDSRVDITSFWPHDAHRVFSVRNISAPDILLMNNTEEESVNEYIKANVRFFDDVMTVWHKKLKSSLPPLLPSQME